MNKTTVQKGRELELRIAKDLRDAGLDRRASRMPRSGAIYGKEADISTSLPIKIEAKYHENWKVMDFYYQAQNHNSGKMPVVVMDKTDISHPMALLSLPDFIELLSYAIKGGFSGELPFSKRRQVGK